MRHLATALLLLLTACSPLAHAQGGTVSSSYMQTFDGMPATPAAYRPPGWDVQIHSRDDQTWTSLEPMVAAHGPACEGPPAQHPLSGDYPASVFQCHDHVMTALQAEGYGVIYLTPPALADFSTGETVIRWDMSTLRTSYRDWVDVWITPPPDVLALPLPDYLPDLAGPPRRSVHIQMTQTSAGSGIWTSLPAELYADSVSQPLPFANVGYETVLTPDAARRDTFEVRLSRTHLQVGMPAYNLWWVDATFPDLGWDQGVVQFGHHSYNPHKECTPSGTLTCTANTWHWDAVAISPRAPLQITPLSPRQLSNLAPGGWTLPSPAPAGSMLQFSANNAPGFVDWDHPGTPGLELSYDGGTAWQTVTPQPSGAQGHDLHAARSYRVPLPPGTTAVQVRGAGGYWGADWQAKDASVWQLTPADLPPTPVPPTPRPTLPPAVTATPGPPFATPTPEATPTFLPTATVGASPTLVSTSTPWPVATVTMTPPASLPPPDPSRPCQVPVSRFGVSTWRDAPTSQCR